MSTDLHARLRGLNLHALADDFDDVAANAIKKRWSPTQLMEHIVTIEEQERSRRSLERRLQLSKLGHFKPASDFDWKWPDRINADAVHAALDLDFLREGKNVVLVGAQGLGKTMLAKNIAHAAVMGGYSAIFITAADLLLDLASQESTRALARRVKHYARVACLCIDEIGYLEYEQRAADLLFQIVPRAAVGQVRGQGEEAQPAGDIFPGAACATALVDRVVHHADVILIEGKSYRLRESTQSEQTSAAKRTPTKKK